MRAVGHEEAWVITAFVVLTQWCSLAWPVTITIDEAMATRSVAKADLTGAPPPALVVFSA
jgi:hypothetical protein